MILIICVNPITKQSENEVYLTEKEQPKKQRCDIHNNIGMNTFLINR